MEVLRILWTAHTRGSGELLRGGPQERTQNTGGPADGILAGLQGGTTGLSADVGRLGPKAAGRSRVRASEERPHGVARSGHGRRSAGGITRRSSGVRAQRQRRVETGRR